MAPDGTWFESFEHEELHPPGIDTNTAHPARMYDYALGGKTHFAADREAAERVLAVAPYGRDMAIANRAFLGRAVRFLAGQGIGQFLDIGTGIPSPGNTREVLRAINPDARVVYVDNDPIVIAHSRALLRDGGPVSVVAGDLRDPEALLAEDRVRRTLDFGKPMAVLLVAVLHFIKESEEPYRIVQTLMDAVPEGSYLVISHGTHEFNPERSLAATHGYDKASAQVTLRTKDAVGRFFGGLEMVDPGLVQLPYWRPDGTPPEGSERVGLYAGAARKGSPGKS